MHLECANSKIQATENPKRPIEITISYFKKEKNDEVGGGNLQILIAAHTMSTDHSADLFWIPVQITLLVQLEI